MLGLACAILTGLISVPDGRFDHGRDPAHAENCNDCHRLRKKDGWRQRVPVGKAGGLHAACTDCHRKKWTQFNPAKGLGFCRSCHRGLTRSRPRFDRIHYPPYRSGESSQFFVPKFGHGDHIERYGPLKGAAGCAQCHVSLEGRKRPKHETCATSACHGGPAAPAMAKCAGCHELGQPKRRATDVALTVERAFSHEGHQKSAQGAACRDCHNNVRTEAGERVPMPAMITCESCHDGKSAFGALGDCQKCHAQKQDITRPVRRPDPVSTFVHAQHQEKGDLGACEACHAGTRSGRVRFPVPNAEHQPCAKCHAEEFRKKDSEICFSCHAHNQPWRPNPRRTSFRDTTEFTVGMPHQSHRKTSCTTCHFVRDPQNRPPAPRPGDLAPSHRLCRECHDREEAPTMTACGACHRLPAALSPNAGAPAEDPWRVASAFSHETHRLDARTQRPLACEACHAEVSASNAVPPPRPKKKSCETCHEGSTAFHVTGFECYRCHVEPS